MKPQHKLAGSHTHILGLVTQWHEGAGMRFVGRRGKKAKELLELLFDTCMNSSFQVAENLQIFLYLPNTITEYLNGHIKSPVLVPGLVDMAKSSRVNWLPSLQVFITNSLVAQQCHLLLYSGRTTATSNLSKKYGKNI